MSLETFKIRNDQMSVKIKRKGAELCSVINQNGTEFIWQAKEVWPRHAPNLFPVVGSLIDHEYFFEGQTLPMKHHGFARDSQFDMLHQSEHSICLVLKPTEESKQFYPFEFTLLITYSLEENILRQTFRVINQDLKAIPVSFGGHPAFNASSIDEFSIELNQKEKAPYILEGPYISKNTVEIQDNDNEIKLTKNIFDQDALVFVDLKSSRAVLRHHNSNYRISVEFDDFPHLGIWSKPGANYVCIEPWQGLADFVGHNKALEDKKGIIMLPKGDEIAKSFSMQFES